MAGFAATLTAVAQPPAQQQKRQQKQAEAQKKSEDDRKAAEAKSTDDAKKADDLAKLEKTLKPPAKLPTGPVTKDPAELAKMIDAAIDTKLAAGSLRPRRVPTRNSFAGHTSTSPASFRRPTRRRRSSTAGRPISGRN